MAPSKSFSFLFSLLAVMVSPPQTMSVNSNFFSEYIGAMFTGVKFTAVPVNPAVQFHFILAFVIDYTTTTSPPTPTDGNFGIFWDSNTLTASAVADVKRNNPNVKVAVSLGGATINNLAVNFTAKSVNSWVANAVSSLTGIIRQYGLDGIDIDYESFDADEEIFSECIGQLISTLKNNGVISFASIAPFDDPAVQSHYRELWRNYADKIDFVNFQFYAYDSSTTPQQYVEYFHKQMANYPGGNVLASFITDDKTKATPETAISACKILKAENELFGIFVWTADESNFTYEAQAQQLLLY